jgi:hypothetical protein
MGLDKDKTIAEIMGAGDEGSLARLEQFVGTGEQGVDNNYARQVIQQRRSQMAAQKQAQEEMERSNQLRGQLTKQAQDYRAALPGLQNQMMDSASDDARRGLSSQMTGIKKAANQRGLLYSGLRAGSEAQAAGEASSGLAQERARINEQTQGQADAYDRMAAQGNLAHQEMGLQDAQRKQKGQDDAYQQAIARRRGDATAMQAGMQAAGQVGGAALGAYTKGRA